VDRAVHVQRADSVFARQLERRGEHSFVQVKCIGCLARGTIRDASVHGPVQPQASGWNATAEDQKFIVAEACAITGKTSGRSDPCIDLELLFACKGDQDEIVFALTALRQDERTPLEPRNAARLFQRMQRKAGLPYRRFYDLRHSCATLLLMQGVHPRVVMEILGHSQISLTMNTYSHVVPTLQKEAASRMDEVLSGDN